MRNTDWDRKYHDIGLTMGRGVVHFTNDAQLDRLLKQKDGGRKLAEFTREAYRHSFGVPIRISEASLDMEVRWHYRLMLLVRRFQKRSLYRTCAPFRKFTDWLDLHMKDIDCGEGGIDSNRFVWDLLAFFRDPLHRRKITKKKQE